MAKPNTLNPEPVRWWLAAAILLAIVLVVPIPAWVIDEFYSRDMYPWFQRIMTTGSNILPFALLDVILLVTAIAFLYRAVRLFHVARQRGLIDAIWEAFRRLVRFAAITALLFLWAWGFNYRRLPLETVLRGQPANVTNVESLKVAFADAASLAARIRSQTQPEGRPHSIALELKEPMNAALRSIGRTPLDVPGEPKYSLVLTPFFNWSGVTGMTNPFGHEILILPELLPYERAFVIAHEWAHLSGQADEAEASAVGWLACMRGGPTLAYSASLYLIMETAAAMPADARQGLMAHLDAGVRSDLDAIAERMKQEKPAIARTANRVYDQYLRANHVPDGTASYGRALSLILASPFRDALSAYTITR
ncbi:MAG TPA: DUF3810 family protein [Vicinamibacterales bacterium]|nr:DUF3810 family protein [Vicinamibacterales bacterium]